MEFDALTLVLLALVIPASFMLSAAAGLGGSLILVPGLMLSIGTREGIAVAALLLACNNIAKVVVYRKTLPWASSALIAAAVMVGSALGATLMLQMPEAWVRYAVATMLLLTLAGDFVAQRSVRKIWAVFLAFLSGGTSGFSGTSGPLKGVAIRSLQLERFYFVGAASLVSMVGDTTKALVFSQSGLITASHLLLAGVLVPVMAGCTLLGRKINREIGEKWHSILFWTVMGGYLTRLMVA
tara:strand:+ start:1610 stop:2329 length:720 start_codon:yes stop_codon:yes gene_type:complete